MDPARELLIRDLSVVEDPVRTTWPLGVRTGPQAAWTFGRLMELMAGNPLLAPQFTLDWLEKWEADQTVNGYPSAARPAIKDLIIDPWLAASGGQTLNMRKAPFRLLAIVYRPDLRTSSFGNVSAGEGRFVFCAVKPDGSPMQFTVIFEYGLPAFDAEDVKEWATRWHKLGSKPFGGTFNHELQEITDKFTRPGCALLKPNMSCINQIRTNEVSLSASKVWELREFRLTFFGKLTQVTTVNTPDNSLNGTAALADFINANQEAAIARTLIIPADFLAPAAPESMQIAWNAPGILDSGARYGFAISTCNGCHTGETGTVFTHVKPRAAGVQSSISGFLGGATSVDPVTGETRTYNELAFRAADLQALLASDPDDDDQGDDNDDQSVVFKVPRGGHQDR